MIDWIWYRWVVGKNFHNKRMTAIYWTEKRNMSTTAAYCRAECNIMRFKRCRDRWT